MDLVKQQNPINPEQIIRSTLGNDSIHHQLPNENKEQLKQQMVKAINAAQFLRQKIGVNQGTHFYKKIFNDQLGLKVYDYSAIWNKTSEQVKDFSLSVPLRQVLMSQLRKLIQIQFQIDIKTNKLLTLPDGKYIYKFIDQIFEKQYPSLLAMLEKMVEALSSKNKSQIQQNIRVRTELVGPILNFIKNIMQNQFGYMVDPQQFCNTIVCPLSQPIIYSTQEIKKIQTQNLKFCTNKAIQRLSISAGKKASQVLPLIAKKSTQQIQKYVGVLLRKRKLTQKNQSFFEIVTKNRWNFQAVIQESFKQQTKVLNDFNKKKNILPTMDIQ